MGDPQVSGAPLSPDEYLADFRQRFWESGTGGCWKLERQQHFVEPSSESWQAFNAGDWSRSLELLEQKRPDLEQYESLLVRNNMSVRRARVVETPLSPYLVWELNALRIREESGGAINVVDRQAVTDFEHRAALPEVFVIGSTVVYEVRYDDRGALTGAIRSLDTAAVQHWTGVARTLYGRGEQLAAFYHREVAGRRPPHAA